MKTLNARKLGFKLAIAVALTISTYSAMAAGMVPETSVVIVNEADGEGTINVKNTDNKPALLHVNIENLPEDTEALLIATPPVSRVEGSDTQLVRFILQSKVPLTTQRLKRVTFEGIPQKTESDTARIGFTVSQNLPVIIHPKGLVKNGEPWKLLSWGVVDGKLVIKNNSAYVVRMEQAVTALPAKQTLKVSKSYILPGEELIADEKLASVDVTSVRIYPATVYGFSVASYDLPLVK